MKNQVKKFSQYIKESDEMPGRGHDVGRAEAEYEPVGSYTILGRLWYNDKAIVIPYPEDILGDNLGEYADYAEGNADAYNKWICKFAKLYGITVIHDQEGGPTIYCKDYV